MLPGLGLPHVRPEGTSTVSETVPLKPFNAVRVMIDAPEDPVAVSAGELALITKSWKLKVAVAVRVREPLVPVTVNGYAPSTEELQETTATPEPAIELGVMLVHVRPDGTMSVSVIVPAKPPNAATLTVELLDSPTSAVAGVEAEMVKSEANCVPPGEIIVLQ